MKTVSLTPLAKRVLAYIEDKGSITAQEAFLYLDGTTSGTLSRRITEIEDAGTDIARESAINRHTGKRYTRYSLNELCGEKDFGYVQAYPGLTEEDAVIDVDAYDAPTTQYWPQLAGSY